MNVVRWSLEKIAALLLGLMSGSFGAGPQSCVMHCQIHSRPRGEVALSGSPEPSKL